MKLNTARNVRPYLVYVMIKYYVNTLRQSNITRKQVGVKNQRDIPILLNKEGTVVKGKYTN